jgi:predicted nucleic acid-binding protein
MGVRLGKTILVDSGFWFALFNERDTHHQDALNKEDVLWSAVVLLPWPSLYETINTRFVKDEGATRDFKRIVGRPNTIRVDDSPYREEAFVETLREAAPGDRPIGLVDVVIRLMLSDGNLRVNYLLTYNVPDFADICRRRMIQIL